MNKRTMQEIANFFGVGVLFDGYRTVLKDDYGFICAVSNRLVHLDGVAPHTVVSPVTDTCTWHEDDDGHWHTDCKQIHTFFDGGPVENEHKFCPYCGRELKVESYQGEDDDGEIE